MAEGGPPSLPAWGVRGGRRRGAERSDGRQAALQVQRRRSGPAAQGQHGRRALGSPVVPEVYIRVQQSSAVGFTARRAEGRQGQRARCDAVCPPTPPNGLGAMRCAHPTNQPHTHKRIHTTTTIHVPPADMCARAALPTWLAGVLLAQSHKLIKRVDSNPILAGHLRRSSGSGSGQGGARASRTPRHCIALAGQPPIARRPAPNSTRQLGAGAAAMAIPVEPPSAQPQRQRDQQGRVSSVGSGPRACLGRLGVGLAPVHDRLDLVSHARQHLGKHCQFVPGRKHSSRLCEGWGAVAESTKA